MDCSSPPDEDTDTPPLPAPPADDVVDSKIDIGAAAATDVTTEW